MIRLSEILSIFEAEFLARYSDAIPAEHLRALAAMKDCRTSRAPQMLAECAECQAHRLLPHSCGHRSCPHCQHYESQRWLEQQIEKQVPGEYFLLTFTLPEALRALARNHQRFFYPAMIRCSWETLKTFTRNDPKLKGTPGATAVLHTHSRQLNYHPHVHLVMPAAAIDPEHRLWRTKAGYLFNEKALAIVFQAKMLAAITAEGLSLPSGLPKKWIVHCTGVGSGEKALIYLGRYLYRGVLPEKDIIACQKGQVTFRFQNSKTKAFEYRTLPGVRFLGLILQHVLPKGFRRARNFGFLHPNSKRFISLLQYLFNLNPNKPLAALKPRPLVCCPGCGAPMTITRTKIPPPPRHNDLSPSVPRGALAM